MGKGTIISDKGNGLYSVKLIYGRGRTDAELLLLNNKIDTIDTESIPDAAAEVSAAQFELDNAQQVLSAAQSAYDGSSETQKAVTAAQSDVAEASARLTAANSVLSNLKIDRSSALSRVTFINDNMPDDNPVVDAWCADYTENLTGDVATVELPDELLTFSAQNDPTPDHVPLVNIRPGFSGGSAYDQERDGFLRSPIMLSPAEAYYNRAILPGVQKWKPQYRAGTITEIINNFANIELDVVVSSAQGLSINQTDSITAPIEYMDCNEAVFEVGDHVLIYFENRAWETPKVIGFIKEPRDCGLLPYIFIPTGNVLDDSRVNPNADDYLRVDFFDGIRTVEVQPVIGSPYWLTWKDPVYDVETGIVWDMENDVQVEIRNPDTQALITSTTRGDVTYGTLTRNGVYPWVAEKALGVRFLQPALYDNGGTLAGRSEFGQKGYAIRSYVNRVSQGVVGDWIQDTPTLDYKNKSTSITTGADWKTPATGGPSILTPDGDFRIDDGLSYNKPPLTRQSNTIVYRGDDLGGLSIVEARTIDGGFGPTRKYTETNTIAGDIVQSSVEFIQSPTQADDETKVFATSGGKSLFTHLARSVIVEQYAVEKLNDGIGGQFELYETKIGIRAAVDCPTTYGTDRNDNDSYDHNGGTWATLDTEAINAALGSNWPIGTPMIAGKRGEPR